MRKIYILLLITGVCGLVKQADSQPIAAGYDSLKRLLPLQKTEKDRLYIYQQLVDSDPTFSIGEAGNVERFLKLDQDLHLVDPFPYQLLQKAWQFTLSGHTREALNTTEQAVYAFDKQHKKLNGLLFNMRMYFNKLNDQEARLKFYQQQLEYYRVNGPVENTAPCYHGIAGYYYYKAEYNLSITNYLEAAEVYRKFNPVFYLNGVSVAAGNYVLWGSDERALYFLQHEVKPLIDRQGKYIHNNVVSVYWLSLCEIDDHQAHFDKALDDINQGISHFTNQESNTGLYAVLLVWKATLLVKTNRSSQALPLLNKAKFITDSAGYPLFTTQGALQVDYGFYQYYRSIGQNDRAGKYLQAASAKAAREHANALRIAYFKASTDFYESLNQPIVALRYNHKYHALLDSLNEADAKYKIAQFEIDQKDRQQQDHITQLKQEKAVQDYQLSRRNALLWFSLLVVAVVSGLSVFIYRQLRINKKTLIALRQTQGQLIQSEKMASLGELTAGIAHEIQNPLNFVNNFSEINKEMIDELKTELKNGDVEEALAIADGIQQNEEKINHHGKRADFIVKGMLLHSRNSSGDKEPTNINTMADEFLKLSYQGLRAKDKNFNAALVTNFDTNLPMVNIAHQDIGRVLLNMFNNAFYAVNQKQKTAGTDYKPEVSVSTSLEKNNLVIKVKDNGNGIPDAIKEKIMQPFFTTKPTGEGTGLGLSLSYDIVVKGHRGSITVNTKEGEFSEFTILLPT